LAVRVLLADARPGIAFTVVRELAFHYGDECTVGRMLGERLHARPGVAQPRSADVED
jgi:hypothetical protein